MYCQKCGLEIPDASTFCLHCGSQVMATQNDSQPSAEARTSKFPISGLIFLALIFVGTIAAANMYQRSRANEIISKGFHPSQAQVAVPFIQPTPYWEKGSINSPTKVLAVEPGSYLVQKFSVDEKWRNARIKGRFKAQGGNGNDIMVWITDEDGLENFKNRHSFNTWYESGKTTVGKFDVQLASGNYYLLISNKFSVFANKIVNLEMQISFEYLKQP